MHLFNFFADLNGGAGDANTSLTIAVVSGCVTIVVAVIGLLGTRTVRRSNRNNDPAEDEVVSTDRLLIQDLRERNTGLLESVRHREAEIDRLEQVCWTNGINPHTGQPFTRRRDDPHE